MKHNWILILATVIIGIHCNNEPTPLYKWEKLTAGLDFPEGPAISDKGDIYFSNCHGGWIGVFSDGQLDTFLVSVDTSWQRTNGMVFRKGCLYACEYGLGKILKISLDGKIEDYATEWMGGKFNRPNDLTFDTKGNLYFTDPNSWGPDKLDGRIFLVRKGTGEVVLLEEGLAFPNGIGINPVNEKLIVAESAKSRVLSFDIQDNGTLTNKQVFIELPGADPDGFNFDVKGNCYITHHGTGHLFIVNIEGKIIETLKTPGLKPTNVEFGGKDMKTLYLTETETNSLYMCRTKYKGVK
ncbi:MAG: SMP-30/gluconolactonase/LRE family protein [Candidatus Marinimicrobia bacterium]|nr:SMP-30/gluconolactonase/LRE family protein [Candidatus Neomarinimicrobiota bacterium]